MDVTRKSLSLTSEEKDLLLLYTGGFIAGVFLSYGVGCNNFLILIAGLPCGLPALPIFLFLKKQAKISWKNRLRAMGGNNAIAFTCTFFGYVFGIIAANIGYFYFLKTYPICYSFVPY